MKSKLVKKNKKETALVKVDQKLVRKRGRKRKASLALFLLFVFVVALFSYVTNPFVKFSLIVDPYHTVEVKDGQFEFQDDTALFVRQDAFFRRLAQLKQGWHIFSGRFAGGPKAKQGTIDEIIQEIHSLRFNPEEPFLISGDHFSVLYPRNLGIFYNSVLDPRTALNEEDWKNRQLIYLKTVAYALQVYSKSDHLSTTIVPIAPRSVALMNSYAPPSDTLYGMLYGLKVLTSEDEILNRYPFESANASKYSLQTKQEAAQLLEKYKDSVKRHLDQYLEEDYDQQTGLVRKDIHISSAKDIVFRESAFYDNVIMWRTVQLAQELGIVPQDQQFLDEFKQRILKTYWLENEGYFLEEQSDLAVKNKYYSSDWLIAFMTGFLDPAKPEERPYFVRSIKYIQRNAIDQPFGLQFHPDFHPGQLVPIVRMVAPEYGSTAIWSNWGQEYTKLLVRLYQVTGDPQYLDHARYQVNAYSFNIKRYQGYPELYDKNGDFYRKPFYKSVRQTGWVVSYEQARAMYEAENEKVENSGKKTDH